MPGRNRLSDEPSPYLQQHAHDPVAWYPWGDEAFAAAKALDRPVLLSIGYSSCHWCHVMARESFRDPEVAALLNAEFVSVKVDREERPDVDAVYMAVLQAMTGGGGWPLTMALTPDRRPFYGGTYFPPDERPGMPSFTRVLTSLAAAWRTRRDDVLASAADLARAAANVGVSASGVPGGAEAVRELRWRAEARLEALEDRTYGGFGGAPKFPTPEALLLLLGSQGAQARAVALRALDAMGRGGIADAIGGGFFRYAVDAAWRVPHFEKMLYDNAALLRAYARAAALTGEPRYRGWADGIVGWLARELRAPDGAFHSALDAESGGEEGGHYLWTAAEFRAALAGLGEECAQLAAERYGILEAGPVAGANVPRLAASVAELAARHGRPEAEVARALEAARARLLERRQLRARPGADDKVLASWNGLVIGALAEAALWLAEPRFAELATAAADALRASAWRDGRLWHSRRGAELRVEGLLEDYAYLGLGLVKLYRATFESRHLAWALELADAVSERFHDAEAGGYFNTADDFEKLITRPKGHLDGATPSENAAAAELVWWAARYRDDPPALAAARAAVGGLAEAAAAAPQALASSLALAELQAAPQREAVLVGRPDAPDFHALAAELRAEAEAGLLILVVDGSAAVLSELPLAEGRLAALDSGGAQAFVCLGGACGLPVATAPDLARQLAAAGRHR